jgi:hypothetical protein
VLAHDRSTRAEVVLDLPAAVAPHRVRKLVTDLIDDFAEVDSNQPIVVLPQKHPGGNPLASYRAAFWVSQYAARADVEGRILRRSWYAFRREPLAPHAEAAAGGQEYVAPAMLLSAVCAALRTGRAYRGEAADPRASAVIEAGEYLQYDDGERVVLPERLAGCFCILIDGQLSEIPAGGDGFDPAGRATGYETTRAASLARIERALAARIGPYAGPLLADASAGRASLAAICALVAQEIDDPQQREAFLREASPAAPQVRGPGMLFRCQPDAAQRLVPHPPLCAVDYALVLVAPEDTLIVRDAVKESAASRLASAGAASG